MGVERGDQLAKTKSQAELYEMLRQAQDNQQTSDHGRGYFQTNINDINYALNKIRAANAPGVKKPAATPASAAATTPPALTATSVLDLINNYRNSGFDKNLIGDSLDDDYVNQLVAGQGSSILGQLSQMRAEGKLSGVGYDAAMAEYGLQRDSATKNVGDIGSGIIAGGRQSLYDILNRAQSEGVNAPANFKLDPYQTEINTAADTFKTGLHQKLIDSVGGTNYFDMSKILGKVPAAQGSTNTANDSILDALTKAKEGGAYIRPNPVMPGQDNTIHSSSPLTQLLDARSGGMQATQQSSGLGSAGFGGGNSSTTKPIGQTGALFGGNVGGVGTQRTGDPKPKLSPKNGLGSGGQMRVDPREMIVDGFDKYPEGPAPKTAYRGLF